MPAVSETRIAVRFIDQATAELTKTKRKYDDFSESMEKSAQKSINLWHRAGILTAGLGGLMKTIADTDEETKKMTDTFTSGVIAAGSFMTAIGELRSNFQDLLPDIKSATKAVNAHGNIKDNFKPEERQARNALYFHKMMTTQAGTELFKNVYDYLMELLKEYEAATEK